MNMIIGTHSDLYVSEILSHLPQLSDHTGFVHCSTHTEIMQQVKLLHPQIVIVDFDLPSRGGNYTIEQLRATKIPMLIVCFHQKDCLSIVRQIQTVNADFLIHFRNEFDLLIKLIESMLRHCTKWSSSYKHGFASSVTE